MLKHHYVKHSPKKRRSEHSFGSLNAIKRVHPNKLKEWKNTYTNLKEVLLMVYAGLVALPKRPVTC